MILPAITTAIKHQMPVAVGSASKGPQHLSPEVLEEEDVLHTVTPAAHVEFSENSRVESSMFSNAIRAICSVFHTASRSLNELHQVWTE